MSGMLLQRIKVRFPIYGSVKRNRFTKKYGVFLLIGVLLLQLHLLCFNYPSNSEQIADTHARLWSAHEANFVCPSRPDSTCSHFVYLQSGLQNTELPIFCVDDLEIFNISLVNAKAESLRGVHVVVLSSKDFKVVTTTKFDTYVNDADFFTFLISGVKQSDIVLLASFDEMASSLSQAARKILTLYYGGREVETLEMRDNFVMIGQKGLAKGYAYEQTVRRRYDENFPKEVASLSICIKTPLGPLTELPPETVIRMANKYSHRGLMPNCGLDHTCEPSYSVPVWISTGYQNQIGPELCINSYLVFHPLLKYGGTGFNLAQYDPETQQVITQDNFNMLAESQTRLQIFLEKLPENHLLFGVIHDDASRKTVNMSAHGITVTLKLRHRSVGFFVGQKGATLAIESILHGANFNNRSMTADYPPSVTFRGCVPRQVKGLMLSRHPIAESSIEHRFCGVDGLASDKFCSLYKSDFKEWVNPPVATDSHVWSVPIVVLAGNDARALERTLESLVSQFPVQFDRTLVAVYVSSASIDFDESVAIAKSFAVKHDVCMSDECPTIEKLYEFAFEKTSLRIGEHHSHFIFIDKDVVLSIGFLAWMKKLQSDQLAGVSAYNPNAFVGRYLDPNDAFLSDQVLPSPCVLLNTNYAMKTILPFLGRPQFLKQSRPWQLPGRNVFAVTELSRCFQAADQHTQANRAVFLGLDKSLDSLTFQHLKSEQAYKQYLQDFLGISGAPVALHASKLLETCRKEMFEDYNSHGRLPIAVSYSDEVEDLAKIAKTCRMHGIESHFGMYKGSFRLKTAQNEFMVLSLKSKEEL